jgi:hypothetical protein
LTGPEGSRRLRLQISRQSAHEGGKAVSPTHRLPLPTGNIPAISRIQVPTLGSANPALMVKKIDVELRRVKDHEGKLGKAGLLWSEEE